MNWGERCAIDGMHAADPKPGDYWHEMFNGIALVIDAGKFFVVYLSKKKDVDQNHWTWDTNHVEVKSRDEFKKMLSYGTIPGTWASVVPNSKGWEEFTKSAMSESATHQAESAQPGAEGEK